MENFYQCSDRNKAKKIMMHIINNTLIMENLRGTKIFEGLYIYSTQMKNILIFSKPIN